jgi:hypothetical protein
LSFFFDDFIFHNFTLLFFFSFSLALITLTLIISNNNTKEGRPARQPGRQQAAHAIIMPADPRQAGTAARQAGRQRSQAARQDDGRMAGRQDRQARVLCFICRAGVD